MYDQHYHFDKKPFQLNADPDFFFNSIVHRKAMAYMRYGLTQGEGFIVVTGRPGTGKTMLVKLLVKNLIGSNNNNITIGVMVSSQVSADDLLKIVLTSFGLPYLGDDKSTLLDRIKQFFTEQAEQGKRVLMIVDEAQNLPKDSLEELRMLSNFEIAGKSIFQIFLIGQNEFGNILLLPDMEQLRQRVVATYQLKPLDEEETKSYILFRLEKAGWTQNPVFEEEIFERICSYTQGIPRRINTLCERILIFGYLEELTSIDLIAVNKVISEMDEELSNSKKGPEKSDVTLLKSEVQISQVNNSDGSLEARIYALEQIVLNLQETIKKERTLLRKAILIQLDMDSAYSE